MVYYIWNGFASEHGISKAVRRGKQMKRERLISIIDDMLDGYINKYSAADLILDEIEKARPSPVDPVRAALEEACEPWSFHIGDPPEYDSPLSGVFGAGITYTEQHLAELLGVANFERGDGSEDFRKDAGNTLLNILAAAGLYDKDEDRFATLSVSVTPEAELVVVQAFKYGY